MNSSNKTAYITHQEDLKTENTLFSKIAVYLLKVIFYLIPVTTLIGSIGNALVFAVFSRNKFQKIGFAFYFRKITISDTGV
jgi:hypothetical protein